MTILKKLFWILSKNWPVILMLAIVFIFFWKVFIQGKIPMPGDFVVGVYYPWLDYKWGFPAGVPVKNPITTDVPSFMYPMQTFAMQQLRQLKMPLWNPLILAGTPLLANFQSAPFSPTSFVYAFLNDANAWTAQVILQHILAAIFTYILLRNWKVSKFGSVVGGVIFAFSGFNMLWSQWNGHTLAAAFIPLILYFQDKYIKTRKLTFAAGLGIALALQVYSGYPQVLIYTALAMGLLLLCSVPKKKYKSFLIITAVLGVFSLLGLGMSSVQILPGAELLSLSQREVEPHPFEWAFLPWSKVITFLAPDYFGNHATKNYWGPQDYTSNTGFVGIVAIVFAIASLYKKFSQKKYILLLAFASLVLAFPTPISVFLWKSGLLGLQAASAHRSLVLFNLAIALLASFGVDYLVSKQIVKVKRFIIISSLILLGYLGYSFYQYSQLLSPKYLVGIKNLIFPFGVLLVVTILLFLMKRLVLIRKQIVFLIFILMCFELYRFHWKFSPFTSRELIFPPTPVLEFLQRQEKPFRVTGSKVIPINMRMPYGLESLEGYDAVYPLRIAKFLAALNGGKVGTDPLGRYGTVDHDTSKLLDLINTKYYLALKVDNKNNPDINGNIHSRFQDDRFSIAFEDKTTVVLESKSVMPRAFMLYEWKNIENDNQLLENLIDPKFDFENIALVEHPLEFESSSEANNSVSFSSYETDGYEIEVETPKKGLLFISDSYYPGWKAYMDDQAVDIIRTDYAFRGVIVPEGKHTIRFEYRPDSFRQGIIISGLSLVAIIFLTISGFKKRRGLY